MSKFIFISNFGMWNILKSFQSGHAAILISNETLAMLSFICWDYFKFDILWKFHDNDKNNASNRRMR